MGTVFTFKMQCKRCAKKCQREEAKAAEMEAAAELKRSARREKEAAETRRGVRRRR